MRLLVTLHTLSSIDDFTIEMDDVAEMISRVLQDGLFQKLVIRKLPHPYFKEATEGGEAHE